MNIPDPILTCALDLLTDYKDYLEKQVRALESAEQHGKDARETYNAMQFLAATLFDGVQIEDLHHFRRLFFPLHEDGPFASIYISSQDTPHKASR